MNVPNRVQPGLRQLVFWRRVGLRGKNFFGGLLLLRGFGVSGIGMIFRIFCRWGRNLGGIRISWIFMLGWIERADICM